MAALTIEEHRAWLDKEVPNEPLSAAARRYETASAKALRDIEASDFWVALLKNLTEWNDEYFRDSGGYLLFPSSDRPKLGFKPFNSLLDKAYRKNVLLNSNWPEAPSDGWVRQDTWYTRTNDIVRTTIVVKYMDGVDHLTAVMIKLCEDLGLKYKMDLEARTEGYYAAHFYVNQDIEIPKLNWDTEVVPIRLEIQVTTQLQDAIRKLTHKGYVAGRSLDKPEELWQWNYKDPNFAPNYLGHILHYIEGMIMEIRDRGRTK